MFISSNKFIIIIYSITNLIFILYHKYCYFYILLDLSKIENYILSWMEGVLAISSYCEVNPKPCGKKSIFCTPPGPGTATGSNRRPGPPTPETRPRPSRDRTGPDTRRSNHAAPKPNRFVWICLTNSPRGKTKAPNPHAEKVETPASNPWLPQPRPPASAPCPRKGIPLPPPLWGR